MAQQNFTPLPALSNIPDLNVNASNFRIGSTGFGNDPGTGTIGTPMSRPNPLQTNINPIPDFSGGNVPGQPGLYQNPDVFGGAGETPGFFSPQGGSRFLIPGLNALTGVGNYFLSKDMLDLGQDQFNFSKEQSNRDFNAQAGVFNTNLEDQKASAMRTSGGYDTSTPEGQAAFDEALDAYVKENSIQDVNL